MEGNFSFFGYSPKPRTEKNTGQACAKIYASNSKLSLKKKQKSTVGLANGSVFKRKGLVKELMPTYDDVPKEKLTTDTLQLNLMLDRSEDKENSFPNKSYFMRHPDSSSVQNIHSISPSRCELVNDADNSIILNFTITSSEVSAISISSVDENILGDNLENVTTIIISDSSCSSASEKSVSLHKSFNRVMNSFICSDSNFCYKQNELKCKAASENHVSDSSLLSYKNDGCAECPLDDGKILQKVSALSPQQNASSYNQISESSSDSSHCLLITSSGRYGNVTSVVEESPSGVSEDSSRFEKPLNSGEAREVTQKHSVNNKVENNTAKSNFEAYSNNLSTSKFLSIQKWLQESPPTVLEDGEFVECDTRLSTITTTRHTFRETVSNVHETKEDIDADQVLTENVSYGKQIHCCNENISITNTNVFDGGIVKTNAHVQQNQITCEEENILSLSAENVLEQLYGEGSVKRHIISKKTQNETRKLSNVLSSNDANDSFDKFVKKLNTECKKKCQRSKTEINSKSFINDGSLSSDGLEFYQRVLNTDMIKKTKTVIESTNLQFDMRKKTTIRKLSYSSSDLNEDDDTDDKEEYLPKKDITKIKDNLHHSKDRGLGVLKPKEKKNIHTKGTLKINTKPIHAQHLHTVQIQTKVLSVKVCSFLESLSDAVSESCCHPGALQFRKNFKKLKEQLCAKLFVMYNLNIFDCGLPKDLQITWNARLQRTAGLCFNRRVLVEGKGKVRTSRIELSTKVCDTADRLRDTLVHELCHAATWVKDGVQSGHGPNWKAWAYRAMTCYPELPPVKRCHEYKIQTKFTYKCSGCGYAIDRHSKSLDTEKKRCGYCYSKFELFVNYKNNSGAKTNKTPKTPRNPNGFALFVKENYNVLRSAQKDLKHGDVMRLLGQQFSAAKIS